MSTPAVHCSCGCTPGNATARRVALAARANRTGAGREASNVRAPVHFNVLLEHHNHIQDTHIHTITCTSRCYSNTYSYCAHTNIIVLHTRTSTLYYIACIDQLLWALWALCLEHTFLAFTSRSSSEGGAASGSERRFFAAFDSPRSARFSRWHSDTGIHLY